MRAACQNVGGARHFRSTPRQVDQRRRRPVVREVTPRADRAPHRAVQALNCVGRVDRTPERRREGEERHHPVPRRTPAANDPRILRPPVTRLEPVQRSRHRGLRRRLVDRLQRRRQRLALLPRCVRQRVPDLCTMHV